MSGSFSHRWTWGEQSATPEAEPSEVSEEASDYLNPLRSPRAQRRQVVQTITPLHYQAGYAYPLLVWLHSAGHNERQIEYVLPHISTRNYVGIGIRAGRAIDVHGRGFDWQAGRNATVKACEMILEAIDHTMDEYSIHPERIVLAGYGSGATLACQVALLQSERFAGLVRMGGEFPEASGMFKNFKALRQRQMPMLWQQAINGVDDDAERLQREIVSAQCIRARVEIRQYRDDDVMNTVALKDIDRWCFDKIISPKPVEPRVGESSLDTSDYRLVDFSAN